MQEFTGEEGSNFDTWFRRFELFFPHPPPDGGQARHLILPLYLNGRAFMTYSALADADKANYAVLRQALRDRLVPGDHNLVRRQEFMGMTRHVGETLPAFELRIMEAVTQAYADFANNARDALAKEQFIRGVGDGDVQMHLLTQNPATLRAAVQVAEQFEQVQRVTGNRSVRALQSGHERLGSVASAESQQVRELTELVKKLSTEVLEIKSERGVSKKDQSPHHPEPEKQEAGSDSYQHGRGRGRYRTKPNFPRNRAPSRGGYNQANAGYQGAVNQPSGQGVGHTPWVRYPGPAGYTPRHHGEPERRDRYSRDHAQGQTGQFQGVCDYCKEWGHKWRHCALLKKQGE